MSLETIPKASTTPDNDHSEFEISPELIIDHGHEPDTIGDASHAESIQPAESSDSRNLTPEDFKNTDF